jgi:hypothetical protein
MRPHGQRSALRPLLLLGLLAAAAVLVVPSRAGVHDQQLAAALVVPHRDVPAYWDATILPNPCSISSYPEHLSIIARAATRWGSPTHGLWSVAAITGSAEQGRVEFAHVVKVLPSCMSRSFQHPPGYSSRSTVAPVPSRSDQADQIQAWKLTQTMRTSKGRVDHRSMMDLVVVRVGPGVAWYELGTFNESMTQTILHHALARAALARR